MKRSKPLTPDERIAQAKDQLAAGSPDYAQAHALIVLAETAITIAAIFDAHFQPPLQPGPLSCTVCGLGAEANHGKCWVEMDGGLTP